MRIAIFSDSFSPIINGVSVSIEGLIEELRKIGHSVHVFTSSYPNYTEKDPNVIRFRSIVTRYAKSYPLAIPPFSPFKKEFLHFRFDIVHTHTPFTVGLIGKSWAKQSQIPLVSTYHTLYEEYAHYVPFVPKRVVKFVIARITNSYYNQCAHIIVPSEIAKENLLKHKVIKPISIIPTGNPAPRKIPREEARTEIGAKGDAKLLLYVGRLAPEKNLILLFRALKRILAERKDVQLWLVGDGPDMENCKRTVRQIGIGDYVVFTGAVPRSKVDNYYAAADVFVFPSTTETQGLVIGEALSYALPVVAVKGGGASVMLENGETGFAVDNESHEFANSVLMLLSNPALWGRISTNARKSSRRWTFRDMAESVLEVYENVLSTRERISPPFPKEDSWSTIHAHTDTREN
ncbi:MAG TPA: glycosyltransferase family 4 protein [Fimbriimonadales bacterium]|nr:glycosyltransferase family 4 protein [Fimbriimonadales bacterium]